MPRNSILFALAAVAFAVAQGASVQQYPTKPIRLIISFPPGGGVDVTARAIAQKLSESLGQQMVVENRAGGNTIISADIAAHAPPDGYTLFMPLDSTLTQIPALYSKLPYDPLRDFVPISQTSVGSYLFVTHPKSPFRTLQELVAYARANPGKLNFAASTVMTQVLTLQLKSAAGIDITYVPYKGTAPMVQALLAGEVDVAVDGVPFYVSSIKSGKMVGIATSGAARAPQLPDTPTFRESGYPQLEARSWFGVFAPAGTPPAIVTRLNGEIVRAMQSPDLLERLAAAGNIAVSSTPEQLGALLREDHAKWVPIIRAAGIKLD
jgi:tripartite-type tricarboxylate transporter receptor subunit TctC